MSTEYNTGFRAGMERAAGIASKLTDSKFSRLVDGPNGVEHKFVRVPVWDEGPAIAEAIRAALPPPSDAAPAASEVQS